MDGTALVPAPVPTEIILIHHGVEQIVSACDLLRPNGSAALEVSGNLGALGRRTSVLLQSQDYRFQLLVDDGELVLHRSGYEIRARPDTNSKSIIWVVWSQTQLQLMLPFNRGQTIWTVRTPIAVPPKSLLQLARVKKLQPTTSFESMEAFRTAVHEAFCSLQDDLAETGAYNGFWDQRYEGRRKSTPVPKKETDIHRQLLLQLYDWAKMRSVEVVPENETAVGKLDICFIGNVTGQGPVSFCARSSWRMLKTWNMDWTYSFLSIWQLSVQSTEHMSSCGSRATGLIYLADRPSTIYENKSCPTILSLHLLNLPSWISY